MGSNSLLEPGGWNLRYRMTAAINPVTNVTVVLEQGIVFRKGPGHSTEAVARDADENAPFRLAMGSKVYDRTHRSNKEVCDAISFQTV